jgi:hypothetical protein
MLKNAVALEWNQLYLDLQRSNFACLTTPGVNV